MIILPEREGKGQLGRPKPDLIKSLTRQAHLEVQKKACANILVTVFAV